MASYTSCNSRSPSPQPGTSEGLPRESFSFHTKSNTRKRKAKPYTEEEWRMELMNFIGIVYDDDVGDESYSDDSSSGDNVDFGMQTEDELLDGSLDVDGDGEGRHGAQAQPVRSRPYEGLVDIFSWRNVDNFHPNSPDFDQSQGSLTDTFALDNEASELDYFQLYFDEDVMDLIVTETSRFYEYCERHSRPTSTGKKRKWTSPDAGELYVFLALLMLMGHVKKESVLDYWLKTDITVTPIFGKYMSRDRFTALLRYMNFADNDMVDPNDRLWKIRPFFTMQKERFVKYLQPFQKVVIDESPILFRGRLSFIQYNPSKKYPFGIKLFVLCDLETGYVLDMIVYPEFDEDIPKNDPLGFSCAVVKKFMDRYLDANHILYTDDYYTSPSLSKYLSEHGKFMPKFTGKLKSGEHQFQATDSILALRWNDRRDVHKLSTIHPNNDKVTGKIDYCMQGSIMKPEKVIDYKQNMCLVDKSDMQVGSIECVLRCVQGYKKMFMHLLDIVVLNAFILYKIKTGKNMSLRIFSKRIIEQILQQYGRVTARGVGKRSREGDPDRLQCSQYISRHHLTDIPSTQGRKKGQKRCHVCATSKIKLQKRKDVTTMCFECEVPLCLQCFVEYHTLKDY